MMAKSIQFSRLSNPTPLIRRLPVRDTTDNSRVIVSTYTNTGNRSEAILYTIQGGGHTFPGSNTPGRPAL